MSATAQVTAPASPDKSDQDKLDGHAHDNCWWSGSGNWENHAVQVETGQPIREFMGFAWICMDLLVLTHIEDVE